MAEYNALQYGAPNTGMVLPPVTLYVVNEDNLHEALNPAFREIY